MSVMVTCRKPGIRQASASRKIGDRHATQTRYIRLGNRDRRMNSPHISFIGGGNMARSLIGGLIGNGEPIDRLSVAEPNPELREALARDFGVAVHADNNDAARSADVLLLAVKPQVMKAVCTGLRTLAQARKPLVISIAAGVRLTQLEAWLGGDMPIVRCMPNTPALIGAGATGAYANTRCTDAH